MHPSNSRCQIPSIHQVQISNFYVSTYFAILCKCIVHTWIMFSSLAFKRCIILASTR
jgi:hypothetical protein